MSEVAQVEEQDEAPIQGDEIEQENVSEYEEEARNLGWVPAEEFRGDADKHIDARTFVERGRQNMPLALSNIKKLHSEVTDLKRTINDQSALHKRELKAQRKRIEADFEDRMRKAVEEGDTEGYDAVKKESDEFQEEIAVTTTSDVPAMSAEDLAATNDFIAENTWYKSDVIMTAAADAASADIAAKFPNLNAEQNLKRTLATIKQEFPHKFGKRTGGSPVEGGRPNPSGAKTKRSFGNLPEDAKAAFARLRKRGVFKDKDIKVDQKSYVDSYRWEDK
jgi:hypothetical protein